MKKPILRTLTSETNRNQIVLGLVFSLLLIVGNFLYSWNARFGLLILAMITAGAALLFYRFPIIPTLIMAFVIPSNLAYYIPHLSAPILAIGLIVVVIQKLFNGDVSFRFTPFLVWLSLLMVWQVTTVIWAPAYDQVAFETFPRTLAIALLVTWTIKKPSHFVAVILCSVLGVVFSTGTAIHEMIDFFRFGLQTGGADVFRDVEKARFFGAWTDPNIMGLSAVPFVVLSYAVMRTKIHLSARVLAALAAIIGCVGIMVSLSRGAILALLVAAIALFLAESRRWILLVGIAVSAWLVLTFTPLDLFSRMSSLRGVDSSVSQRSELFVAGIQMASDFFPFGAGLGNSGTYSPDYCRSLRHGVVLHNAFLDVLVDGGLVGIILFLGTYASVVPQLRISRWRIRNTDFESNLTICMAGAFFAVFFANAVASYAAYSLVWFVLALISIRKTVFDEIPSTRRDRIIEPASQL